MILSSLKDGDDDDGEDGDGDDDDIAREKAGRGKGVRLPSIIPTIQALSVFLAKGNFIPKDFFQNITQLEFLSGACASQLQHKVETYCKTF